jgi:hypothetical protein
MSSLRLEAASRLTQLTDCWLSKPELTASDTLFSFAVYYHYPTELFIY